MTETIARTFQTRQVCELDGCENSVPVTDGQPRRYCCAAHRRTARAQHRAEFEAGASAEAQAVRDTSTRPQAPQPEAAPRGTLVTTTRSRWSRRTVQASVPATTPSAPPTRPPNLPPPSPQPKSHTADVPLPADAAPTPQTEINDAPLAHPPLPEPISAPLLEPAPLPEPVDAPEPAPAALVPGPAPLPEPAVASLPEPTPAPAPVPAPEPAPAPAAPKPAAPSVDLRPSTAARVVRPPLGSFAVGMAEALSAALHSLASNRMRSVLTTIGIIVGVGSVIVLVAMGDGMTKAFNDQWSPFATQIYIKPITGPVATGKAPQHLTDSDLKALQAKDATPDVVQWSRAVASNSVTLAVGQKKAGAGLDGVEENYLDLANRRITAGSWFTSKQMEATSRQAVIGPEVLNELWGPGTDPNSVIGVPMRVGHSTFIVQGVINSDGQDDNVVLVPLSAARAYVVGDNAGKLDIIIAKSSSTATIDQAMSEIYSVLFKQHKVRQDTDKDFNVTNNTNTLNQSMASIRFLSIFILAVAAISLFVGGVGVANIMLVAVTERTREIGIRKAIGAPRRAIMRQFLSEAVMLTALGGLIGSVLGIALCLVGHAVIPKLWPPDPASMTPTPIPLLSATPVVVAFGVSVVIGLLAGGYPAYRASRLRPIEALRFE